MRKRYSIPVGGLLAASLALTACGGGGTGAANNAAADTKRNADAKQVTLTITSNAVVGGKNKVEAAWITDYVIPKFQEEQKKKGVDAKVTFQPNGVDDSEYKTKISLDLSTGGGADVVSLDGIWFGEFAEAGYIAPLEDTVGKEAVEGWSGWKQIKPAVQQLASYKDKRYGIPDGTDGRIIYYNKSLFKQAGLPTDWQPKSWEEILSTAEKLKSLSGVTPLQLNAGTAMGEATSMQGILPLLAGTGDPIWKDDKWQGNSEGLRDVLGLYSKVYGSSGLGSPLLQQEAKGRDKSFEMFAGNKLGIMIEGDYLWRSVINPKTGIVPMANRDEVVGWAKIPAQAPGKGIDGRDFVSMSGGSGRVVNPKTEYPQQAFELLTFMASPEALKAKLGTTPSISARDDVNAELLAKDPLLSFVAKEVLPVTQYRPSLPTYTEVSSALQEATAAIVSGKSADEAAKTYEETLKGIVGGSEHIFN